MRTAITLTELKQRGWTKGDLRRFLLPETNWQPRERYPRTFSATQFATAVALRNEHQQFLQRCDDIQREKKSARNIIPMTNAVG